MSPKGTEQGVNRSFLLFPSVRGEMPVQNDTSRIQTPAGAKHDDVKPVIRIVAYGKIGTQDTVIHLQKTHPYF
jgi:hypothetical protein